MTKKATGVLLAVLLMIVIGLGLLGIRVGAVDLTWADIFRAFTGSGDSDRSYIVLNYRLPRIVLAVLVGAGLSVSGLASQAMLRNPLAAPDTLGVSAGAAFGAVSTVLLVPPESQSVWLTSIAAMAGGLIGGALVYMLSYQGGIDPVRLALVGVAVSACGSTLVQLLVTRSASNANTVLLWLNGSLWGRSWEQVLQAAPVLLIGFPLMWLLGRTLNVMALGDEASRGLGLPLEPMRLAILTLAILLASGSVAAAGTIGFVGLVAPHMARRLAGRDHRILVPAAALLGGALVLTADILGRIISPPVEFPAGLVTAAVGAPYFLYLIWREYRPRSIK